MKTLAERAKFARNQLGLTQKQVADLLGMEQQSYGDIETGKSQRPRKIQKLAEVLQVSIPWLIGEEKETGKVPLVHWHQIPSVYNKPEVLFSKEMQLLDISFKREHDLFATQIPSCIDPGHTNHFFRKDEFALISPSRKPASAQHVIVIEDDWLEPVFAYYWIQGGRHTIRYPWELRLQEITDKMQICGVVVATMNLFLLQS